MSSVTAPVRISRLIDVVARSWVQGHSQSFSALLDRAKDIFRQNEFPEFQGQNFKQASVQIIACIYDFVYQQACALQHGVLGSFQLTQNQRERAEQANGTLWMAALVFLSQDEAVALTYYQVLKYTSGDIKWSCRVRTNVVIPVSCFCFCVAWRNVYNSATL